MPSSCEGASDRGAASGTAFLRPRVFFTGSAITGAGATISVSIGGTRILRGLRAGFAAIGAGVGFARAGRPGLRPVPFAARAAAASLRPATVRPSILRPAAALGVAFAAGLATRAVVFFAALRAAVARTGALRAVALVAAFGVRPVVLAAAAFGVRPGDLRAVVALAAFAAGLLARVALAAGLAVREAGFFATAFGVRVDAALVARFAGAALALRAAGALATGLAAFVAFAAGFALATAPRLVAAFIAIARPRGGVPTVSSLLIAPNSLKKTGKILPMTRWIERSVALPVPSFDPPLASRMIGEDFGVMPSARPKV